MAKIPATRARKAPKEIGFHMSVAAFMRRAWPEHLPWFHCPNGEKRDKATAGKLKAMGVLAGVPDITVLLPNGQAAFLELKAAAGETSDAQEDFRTRAVALRCGYATARTMEEVEQVLSRWLGAFGLKLRASILGRAA